MDELQLLQKMATGSAPPLTDQNGLPVELPVPGGCIGHLRVESILGYGGIGVVYRATDPATEAVRAVKIPFPGASLRDIDRFRDEARICAHLDHPNIVRVFAVAMYREVLPYAEMEFVDGMNVLQHVSEKPLPAPVALSIVVLLCRALEYANAQTFTIEGNSYRKMVHRDIKPANILISSTGVVKLADFGLAKFEGVDLHTITGAMPGTVPYMAPEQHQSPVASVRTDIYSLGVTLYEMVTGKRPFPERGPDAFVQLITAKNNGTYTSARQVDSTLPPQIDKVISRCLQPDTRKRYSGYAALRMALESILGDYAGIDATEIVALYCGNRKHYRMAVGKGQGRLQIPKPLYRVAIVSFVIAISVLLINHFAPFTKKTATIPPAMAVTKIADSLSRHNEPASEASVPDRASVKKTARPFQTNSISNNAINHRDVRPMADKKQIGSPHTGKPAGTSIATTVAPFNAAVVARQAKRYTEVIRLLKPLSLDTLVAVQRDSSVLFLVEAYYRNSQINEALMYGTEHPINDGGYYLLMAFLFDAAELPLEAENYYNRAVAAPCRLEMSVRADCYLYRARFFQKKFSRTANSNDREKMVAAWRDFIRNCCSQGSPDCDDARRMVGG